MRSFERVSLLSLVLVGCSSTTMGIDGGDHGDAVADVPPPPSMVCHPGTAWDQSHPVFQNTTADWGLSNARGSKLAVADIDNDGYPDLIVMVLGTNMRSNLSASPPVYQTQVFMNRPRIGAPGRRFVDATMTSNFLVTRAGDGYGRATDLVTFADVDNDGDLDAFAGTYVNVTPDAQGRVPDDTGDRSTLLLNDGHGVFSLGPLSDATPTLDNDPPQTSGTVFTDTNHDGVVDLFVGYWYDPYANGLEVGQQHQLFQGHGDGLFTDITDSVGLTLSDQQTSFATGTNRRPLYGATVTDVNDDGWPDLIGATYGRQFNLLYVNDGARFHEVGRPSGVAGDMITDYSDNQSYLCYCQTHPTQCPAGLPAPVYQCPVRGWRPGSDDQPYRLNGNTFTIVSADVNNDGLMDLYTTEIVHPDVGISSDPSQLLINQSTAENTLFSRPDRASLGLSPGSPPTEDEGGLGAGIFDFDNDGRLDIFLQASDYAGQFGWLYHQNEQGTFNEVGTLAGMHHACPHGLAIADFDRDGDVDVIVGSSTFRDCAARWPHGAEVRIYENVLSDTNWTSVRLVGRGAGGANRSALGARVRITTGDVTQTREMEGSWGCFALGSELVVHAGLGTHCMIDRLEVRWPDAPGTIEAFTNVLANYDLEIRQGEGRVRYLVP